MLFFHKYPTKGEIILIYFSLTLLFGGIMKTTIITLFFAMFLLTACAQTTEVAKETKEPIVIGALFPLTGGLSTYGEVAQSSALLAMEDINSAGGINGQ